MLHSQYDFRYVLTMPVKYVNKLLASAFKNKQIEKQWDMWIARYQHMTRSDFISFDDFCKSASTPQASTKTEQEIMDDVELIQHSLRGEISGDL